MAPSGTSLLTHQCDTPQRLTVTVSCGGRNTLLSSYVNVMLQNNLMSLCLQLDLHEFSNTLKKKQL